MSNISRKTAILTVGFYTIFFIAPSVGASNQSGMSRQNKILQRATLINEGDRLVDKAFYDDAIKKYKVAARSELLNYAHDIAVPYGRIESVLMFQGKFEEAAQVLGKVIAINKRGTGWEDPKYKLNALMQARNSGSRRPIYDHIEYLKTKHKNDLPPRHTSFTAIVASDIIRLYDYIGDYDAGIQFVDQLLNYKKLGKSTRQDYLKIRQVFMQDKVEGTQSCFETQVQGEACVGRATQVIIQSKYLPW